MAYEIPSSQARDRLWLPGMTSGKGFSATCYNALRFRILSPGLRFCREKWICFSGGPELLSFQELHALAWAGQFRNLKAVVPINDHHVAARHYFPPDQQFCGVAHLLIQLND